ncbi:MAG: contractile injection system protein, VgrG/Pvc8 family [Myxococcota bacterium]|nr:contractile injection system protein, VgrG/Pvc8 family [Myxococcota bacterium]
MISIDDRSAPGVRVTVLGDEKATEGTPIDLDGRIISFAFEDNERKADKVTLQLDNFDLSLFDREELMGGAVLEVSWGYPGNMAPPRRVVVKKLKGFQTLTIEGVALSMLMNQQARTRRFENTARSEVVQEIAAGYGYEGGFLHVQATDDKCDVINQSAETDARFLRRLAALEGFEFFVDHTGFHWHERRLDTVPIKVFSYYVGSKQGDILSLSIESDLTRRAGKVSVKGRDPLKKATIESNATSETVDRATLGEVIEVVDPETGETSLQKRNAVATVHPTSANTSESANRESAARFRKAERATIKISMQVVGDPTLNAKRIIELQGVSVFLSGKYYVKAVKHSISSSGYVCDLKLTKDSPGRLPQKQVRPQGGEKNRNEPVKKSELVEVEVIDPETGESRIEYRSAP